MNFKFFKGLGIVMLGSMALVGTACSDDDDKGMENANEAVTDFEGTRISSVGGISFEYDNKGRLIAYTDSYGDGVEIDYSKGKIYADDEDMDEMDFKLNGNGYLSQLSQSWNYVDKEYDYSSKGSGSVTISYNGDGYLTSFKSTAKGTEKEDGETYSWTEEVNVTYTWSKGNLVKIVEKGSEIEDGEKDTWTDTYDLTYSETDNFFKQYTYGMSTTISGGCGPISMVGLLGKGSAQLPSSINNVYVEVEDGRTYTDEYNYNYSFRLNDNGSIKSETQNYNTYNYRYEDSRAGLSVNDENEMVKLTSLHSMFVHKRHRLNRK